MLTSPISLLLFFNFFNPFPVYSTATSLCILVILFNFLIAYYIFSITLTKNEAHQQSELVNQLQQFQISNLEQTSDMIMEIRKQRHELKNNYFYIYTLLQQEHYTELTAYLENALGNNLPLYIDIKTGHTLVDLVISQAMREAKKHNIPIMVDAVLPKTLTLQNEDISALLLNLLNNAIEASQKEVGSDIQLTMKVVKNYLTIRTKNTCTTDILHTNPSLLSTKANKKDHGIGLHIIRSIVNRYEGMIDFSMEGPYFIVTIMLQLST